jgi:hypothetical protein
MSTWLPLATRTHQPANIKDVPTVVEWRNVYLSSYLYALSNSSSKIFMFIGIVVNFNSFPNPRHHKK